MTDEEKKDGCIMGAVVLLFVGLAIWIACAITSKIQQGLTDDWWQKELSRRGHAHYYLDANDQRQWNWKEPAK